MSWPPSLGPGGVHDTVYLVVDCLGDRCAWRKADINGTDLETVISDLMSGQYGDPPCVVAFNATEKWSHDVTAEIAAEIKYRCDRSDDDVPAWFEDFMHRHVSPEKQPALRLGQ